MNDQSERGNAANVIDDLLDPRLEPYRDLKRPGETRWNRPLIAEGHRVTRRAFRVQWPVLSVLISQRRLETEEGASIQQEALRGNVPVYVVDSTIAEQLVGFNFHAGILAHLGRPRPERWESWRQGIGEREPLLAFSRLSDPENVGLAMRNAAAFGVERLLVGSASADPLGRRALRLSMGAALKLKILRTARFVETLDALKGDGVRIVATVCDANAPNVTQLPRDRPTLFLMGNESDGLEPELEALADQRVTIPLAAGVDSLNVATAAALLLYEFCRQA